MWTNRPIQFFFFVGAVVMSLNIKFNKFLFKFDIFAFTDYQRLYFNDLWQIRLLFESFQDNVSQSNSNKLVIMLLYLIVSIKHGPCTVYLYIEFVIKTYTLQLPL